MIAAAQQRVEDAGKGLTQAQKLVQETQKALDEASQSAEKAVSDLRAAEDLQTTTQTDVRAAETELKAKIQAFDEDEKELHELRAAAKTQDQEAMAEAERNVQELTKAVAQARQTHESAQKDAATAAEDVKQARQRAQNTATTAQEARQRQLAAEEQLHQLISALEKAKQDLSGEEALLEQAEENDPLADEIAKANAEAEQARQALDEAEKQLGKPSSEDLDALQQQVTKAQEELEKSKKVAADQIAKGSLGFFEKMATSGDEAAKAGALAAQNVLRDQYGLPKRPQLENFEFQQGADKYRNRAIEHSDVGAEGDATSLELMKEAIEGMAEVNKFRLEEGGLNGEKLTPLSIDDYSMATAQVTANWVSKVRWEHPEIYPNLAENLAQSFKLDVKEALHGWWTLEKQLYQQIKTKHPDWDDKKIEAEAKNHAFEVDGGEIRDGNTITKLINRVDSVGHYYNLADEGYKGVSAGYAVRKSTISNHYIHVFEKDTVDWSEATGSNTFKRFTVDEYRTRFTNYYAPLKEAAESGSQAAREQLAAAEAKLHAAQGGAGSESPDLSKLRETLAKAEERLAQLQRQLQKNVGDLQARVRDFTAVVTDLTAQVKAQENVAKEAQNEAKSAEEEAQSAARSIRPLEEAESHAKAIAAAHKQALADRERDLAEAVQKRDSLVPTESEETLAAAQERLAKATEERDAADQKLTDLRHKLEELDQRIPTAQQDVERAALLRVTQAGKLAEAKKHAEEMAKLAADTAKNLADLQDADKAAKQARLALEAAGIEAETARQQVSIAEQALTPLEKVLKDAQQADNDARRALAEATNKAEKALARAVSAEAKVVETKTKLDAASSALAAAQATYNAAYEKCTATIATGPVFKDSDAIEAALNAGTHRLAGEYTITRGEKITFTVAGLTANAQARVYLYSTPAFVANMQANSAGKVSINITTTTLTEPGTHYVVATSNVAGDQPTVITRLNVLNPTTPTPEPAPTPEAEAFAAHKLVPATMATQAPAADPNPVPAKQDQAEGHVRNSMIIAQVKTPLPNTGASATDAAALGLLTAGAGLVLVTYRRKSHAE
ncbi:LPXTG cell wall anchor domain-containing protein [Trueperella pecoris]|uniref:LPXTG cell wall anchor domain-containing protein n=1 Tax=Trueperella pecoris TaxID=2733571 RepID=A0A7M1R317_9ACTO|nr:LPXTG cell wall anchor domain-containing protein [Trueperella pecoris]QOR47865.1 LPXTG cell wall anchor domain-containing protein [Trueperella pecoris]